MRYDTGVQNLTFIASIRRASWEGAELVRRCLHPVIDGVKKVLFLFAYYLVAIRFPTQPVPGWRFGYWLRRRLMEGIAERCGRGVVVKQNAYVGSGRGLCIGNDSQLGDNCRIGPNVTIGDDVVMGPDVVIMTTSHAFEDPTQLVRRQGELPVRPVRIGNDVWIGTRVIILPGVAVGDGSVIGAGSVVTCNVPAFAIAAGNPARVLRRRGDRARSSQT